MDNHKAIYIGTRTDRELHKKKEFAEKDAEVICSPALGGVANNTVEFAKQYAKDAGFGYSSRKGKKPDAPNQDSYCIFIVEGLFTFYAVFDGHGPSGHYVSEIARKTLMKCFLTKLADSNCTVEQALTDSFHDTHKHVELTNTCEDENIRTDISGTTCTVVYHDAKNDAVYIAHVGDSRSIILKKTGPGDKLEATALTEDHKPELTHERSRIESANPPGRVIFDGYYNYRVFCADGMYPGLNMSRAIGDITAHKKCGLIATPEIKKLDLRRESESASELVLLLCTDGVWEFINNEEIPSYNLGTTAKCGKPDYTHKIGQIVQESYNRWMKDSDNEISDDITGIVVNLKLPDR